MNEKKKEPFFHIVKRDALPWYQSVGIRAIAIVLALIVCAIENAIQQDGSPANLKYIDFVKVHTAQMGQGAAVGEISTESSAAMDLRLKP